MSETTRKTPGFSDEELRRLKEEIEGSNPTWEIHIESDLLNALLIRLEMAERVCRAAHMVDEETMKAWEKACGK